MLLVRSSKLTIPFQSTAMMIVGIVGSVACHAFVKRIKTLSSFAKTNNPTTVIVFGLICSKPAKKFVFFLKGPFKFMQTWHQRM